MKRPLTLFLLFVFAAAQIYFAKLPVSHQVQGSTWIQVSAVPGGLVERNQDYYLVGTTEALVLHANGVHITATPNTLTWMDVPEPSGQNVWHLAVGGPSAIPLVGVGGQIYPAPDGQSVVWIDGLTKKAYVSNPVASALTPIQPNVRQVERAVWASDSHALAILGKGPEGPGVYVWDGDHQLQAAILPGKAATVTGFGITQNETIIAALSSGRVVMQGTGLVSQIPQLTPIAVARHQDTVLGMTANQVILWHAGNVSRTRRPDLVWSGVPRFSKNGQFAAVLAHNRNGAEQLLLYGPHQHWSISVPYPNTAYHLIGFIGDHWVLVTVASGPHHGTYAWWING